LSVTYFVGDTARLTVTFRDRTGTLVDPSSVVLGIEFNGNTATYTTLSGVQRVGLGVYRYDYLTTTAGTGIYTWTGTGSALGNRMGTLRVLATSERLTALFGWDPSGDHAIFDGLEKITLTQRNGAVRTVERVLRLPSNADQGMAGNVAAFGAIVNWNLWTLECPEPPQINSLITDAYGRKYRVNRVTNSVLKSMWEVETTADAGEAI
jgi:hypothetical protein